MQKQVLSSLPNPIPPAMRPFNNRPVVVRQSNVRSVSSPPEKNYHVVVQWFVLLLNDLQLISCAGFDFVCRDHIRIVSCPSHSPYIFQSFKVHLGVCVSNPLKCCIEISQGTAPSDPRRWCECLNNLTSRVEIRRDHARDVFPYLIFHRHRAWCFWKSFHKCCYHWT